MRELGLSSCWDGTHCLPVTTCSTGLPLEPKVVRTFHLPGAAMVALPLALGQRRGNALLSFAATALCLVPGHKQRLQGPVHWLRMAWRVTCPPARGLACSGCPRSAILRRGSHELAPPLASVGSCVACRSTTVASPSDAIPGVVQPVGGGLRRAAAEEDARGLERTPVISGMPDHKYCRAANARGLLSC